jgi:hypothetical protein
MESLDMLVLREREAVLPKSDSGPLMCCMVDMRDHHTLAGTCYSSDKSATDIIFLFFSFLFFSFSLLLLNKVNLDHPGTVEE